LDRVNSSHGLPSVLQDNRIGIASDKIFGVPTFDLDDKETLCGADKEKVRATLSYKWFIVNNAFLWKLLKQCKETFLATGGLFRQLGWHNSSHDCIQIFAVGVVRMIPNPLPTDLVLLLSATRSWRI
jgi:hypothetical protein